jgi:FKBP-type peptidyl-prolyl cis-trans isomerase 2
MKAVENGDVVQLSIEGKLENGRTFFNNKDNTTIIIGEHQIFPALEKRLIGMKLGETKTVNLEAKDAYGLHNEELILSISKEKISDHVDVTRGNTLEMDLSDGKKITGIIIENSDNAITVDFNHPFAGNNISITCTVISIEKQHKT